MIYIQGCTTLWALKNSDTELIAQNVNDGVHTANAPLSSLLVIPVMLVSQNIFLHSNSTDIINTLFQMEEKGEWICFLEGKKKISSS